MAGKSYLYRGDKGIYNGNSCTVVGIAFDAYGNRVLTIKFDNKKLVPNEIDVIDNLVDEYNVNHQHLCPNCRTPWTETKFGNKVWYDCNRCKKRKEDLVPN